MKRPRDYHRGVKASCWSPAEDLARWKSQADLAGITLSAWIRKVANRAAENGIIPRAQLDEITGRLDEYKALATSELRGLPREALTATIKDLAESLVKLLTATER